jgi:hypothetical protein
MFYRRLSDFLDVALHCFEIVCRERVIGKMLSYLVSYCFPVCFLQQVSRSCWVLYHVSHAYSYVCCSMIKAILILKRLPDISVPI